MWGIEKVMVERVGSKENETESLTGLKRHSCFITCCEDYFSTANHDIKWHTVPSPVISLAFLHTSLTKQHSTGELIFEQALILIGLKDAKSMDSPVLNCISS